MNETTDNENKNISYNSMNWKNKSLSDFTNSWSWGWSFAITATMLAWKKYCLFVLYFILLFVPYLNIASFIIFMIYGWFKWNKWLTDNESFQTNQQKIWAIKALEQIWFSYMVISLIIIWMTTTIAISLIAVNGMIT